MEDYSLIRVFTAPVGNTIPTSGTTATLTANQLGIFLPSAAPATAANIGAADYFFFAQGRPNADLNLRSIKSDKIYLNKVIEKYKITSEDTTRNKIIALTDFTASCDESVSVTIRAFSSYINTSFYNGMTRSFTHQTPCCECGESPCAELSAQDIQDMVDDFADKINADTLFSPYVNAARVGSGATSQLWIQGELLPAEVDAANDPMNFPYEYDTVNFQVFAARAPFTTQDLVIDDRCDVFATVTTLQDISFPRGTYDQVRKVELEYAPYTVPAFKTKYKDNNYNGLLHINAVPGTLYTEYVIKCQNPESLNNWGVFIQQDFTVRLFIPAASAAAFETIMVAKLGAFPDKSGPNISTTTSTTTTTI